MKLKLDLHTHCQEAFLYGKANLKAAQRIVEAVKARGLDGIAVTEHNDTSYGNRIKEIVERDLGAEILIIPGQEIDLPRVQIVELYLDDLVFRFLAHPGYPQAIDLGDYVEGIHGIEVKNGLHKLDLDMEKTKALAQKHDLLLLSNSDAHSLERIGEYYNELEMGQLKQRALKPQRRRLTNPL